MKTFLLLAAAVLVALAPTPVVAAEPKKEPLADRVRKAIDDAKKFLRDKQSDKGNWASDDLLRFERIAPDGATPLALLALLAAGEKPDSPARGHRSAWTGKGIGEEP
jgi:hypothetical protein